MTLLVDLVRAASVCNVCLVVSLGYVWGHNYRRFRSKHTLGLFVFAVLLLAENALAVYFFVIQPTLSTWITTPALVPPIAQGAMAALRVLELGGLAFLVRITWD